MAIVRLGRRRPLLFWIGTWALLSGVLWTAWVRSRGNEFPAFGFLAGAEEVPRPANAVDWHFGTSAQIRVYAREASYEETARRVGAELSGRARS